MMTNMERPLLLARLLKIGLNSSLNYESLEINLIYLIVDSNPVRTKPDKHEYRINYGYLGLWKTLLQLQHHPLHRFQINTASHQYFPII